jgi:hypothetical protein
MRIADLRSRPFRADPKDGGIDMSSRRIGVLSVSAAALLAVTALPSFAGNKMASLDDGHVHGFDGCLTQEQTGVRYFDLANAKSDDGKNLGTVRLTGTIEGIQPKDTLGHQVHVNGLYLGHGESDPTNGHVAVKDASVSGGKCS